MKIINTIAASLLLLPCAGEKAPRVEGENYERLYPAETTEPILIYWDVEWVGKPETAMR